MKLQTGMVISSVKAPDTYNEIVRMYVENGKKMVEVAQFNIYEDDKTVIFHEKEILHMLRSGLAYVINNWMSKN